ncbi:uncharacterized protein LOC121959179 isoform X2 [Plectropomus leopardus]|uniref:uncharacterized protein LOC121959179 isoform X2 n=1 Tax=Plectropomus leopardus TaxID=160734 RepID=UPI001C4BB9CA|nr:uncharacterized protein LOC121959179 isoform X2 [Plectropomus leopardus]
MRVCLETLSSFLISRATDQNAFYNPGKKISHSGIVLVVHLSTLCAWRPSYWTQNLSVKQVIGSSEQTGRSLSDFGSGSFPLCKPSPTCGSETLIFVLNKLANQMNWKPGLLSCIRGTVGAATTRDVLLRWSVTAEQRSGFIAAAIKERTSEAQCWNESSTCMQDSSRAPLGPLGPPAVQAPSRLVMYQLCVHA